MSQYLSLRAWARNSSGAEKGVLATTMAVVLGLTGWALVPTGRAGGEQTISAGSTVTQSVDTGAAGTTGTTGTGTAGTGTSGTGTAGTGTAGTGTAGTGTGTTGSGTSGTTATGTGTTGTGTGPTGSTGTTGTGAGGTGTSAGPGTRGAGGRSPAPHASPTSAAARCGPLASTDVGVTPTQIKVVAVTLDLGGAIGNSAVGVASADQQQQMAQATVDDINARGGVACRKLVVDFLKSNPIDPSTAQQACLKIAAGSYFAAIDLGGFSNPPGVGDCVAQHKVPLLSSNAPTPDEARQYSPYLFSLAADPIVDQRNSILGMAQRGWFSAAQGFKKLGMVMDDCSPEVNQATFDALAQVGIAKSQISVATVSCPSGGFASPSDMAAAVVQHVRDSVTNVIPVIGGGSFKEYSIAAQRQGFKPKYTSTDYDGFEITATGGTGPDVDNFDGTISVSSTKIGANTSGLAPDPATQHCIDLFKRHGLSADLVYPKAAGTYPLGGNICSIFETFSAALDKDPGLRRTGIVTGLDSLGKVSLAYLYGDAKFDRPGKLGGGDYWWVVQFHKDCTCWKVIDPTVHPSFS